ncbi:hypothetical protein BGX34_010783 [Mortierella sp. NVP85]|nr:hypothetical protein BGX34_010783 [Mortierella sp. NVP85]
MKSLGSILLFWTWTWGKQNSKTVIPPPIASKPPPPVPRHGGYLIRELQQQYQQQQQQKRQQQQQQMQHEQPQPNIAPPVYSARQCPAYPERGVQPVDMYTPPEDKKVPFFFTHPGRSEKGSISGGKPFEDANDTMPQHFLVAPPLDDPFVKGKYKPFRILAPCQAPSVMNGDESLFHLTDHEGCTVKNPRDLVVGQRNSGDISFLNAVSAYIFMGAEIAGRSHGFSTQAHIDILRQQPRAQAGGIQARSFYSKQTVVTQQQVDAMKMVFKSAGLTDHHDTRFGLRSIRFKEGTKWVCEDCYQRLSQQLAITNDHLVSLDDYILLTRRSTEIEVTLRCSASVTLFTKLIQKRPLVRKVVIHIESGYFQARERQQGNFYTTMENQFIELGKALREQPLTSVEIRGDRACGPIFDGLQRVLRCSDLKTLHVTGVPRFLQGDRFDNSTYRLKELQFDGVHIDTEDAAFRLSKLLEANPELTDLRLSRSHLTSEALDVLEANEAVKRRFAKLSHLNISDNIFGAPIAVSLVGMALQGKHLILLDLSNNRGFGDAGCRQILELLRFKDPCKLEYLMMDGTDISAETSIELQQYNKHQRMGLWRRLLGL